MCCQPERETTRNPRLVLPAESRKTPWECARARFCVPACGLPVTHNENDHWIVWHQTPDEAINDRSAVHVWRCDLDDPALDAFCDERVLSAAEQGSAERLKYARRQQLYRRHRALQRCLLGRFLEVDPASLVFGETHFGKPFIVEPPSVRCLFSASHSESVFAFVISSQMEPGVDVGVMHSDWDWQPVAEMYLDPTRLAQLRGFAAPQQQEMFLRFWSLREAFGKTTALGIACECEEGVPPERVWDLVFEPASASIAEMRTRWKWSQWRGRCPIGEAVVSVVTRTDVITPGAHLLENG